jgi:hypothetical protein
MSEKSVSGSLRAAQRASVVDGGQGPRRMVPLGEAEALELLASVPFGRVVFTQQALPAIRVVNHALVDGRIVIRTHEGAALASVLPGRPGPGVVVAYEADEINAATRLGWSVVVTGYARLLSGPEAERLRQVVPQPWYGAVMDQVVCLEPELVTGLRMLPDAVEQG